MKEFSAEAAFRHCLFAVLRPSVIIGPKATLLGENRAHHTFVQWLNSEVAKRAQAAAAAAAPAAATQAKDGADGGAELAALSLFSNEYRNFVSVFDVANWLLALIARRSAVQSAVGANFVAFNAGGKQRLSRLALGEALCASKQLRHCAHLIVGEELTEAQRAAMPYYRPPDLAMDSGATYELLGDATDTIDEILAQCKL